MPYVCESRGGLRAVPTFCVTLGWPAFWQDDPATGIDWVHILHSEEHVLWHRPLPAQGRVQATHRIAAVDDEGPGCGALIHFETELHDAADAALLATVRQIQFLRGDGGSRSWGSAPSPCEPLPGAWQPDRHTDYVAAAQAAVLYRLASRDLMPLHAAPRVARQAAYPRPIAHGLNTLGLACRALLKQRPPGAPQRMQSMSTPSRRVAYPGETIRIEMRLEGPRVRFRALALKRGVVVLDRGICHGPAPDAVQRQEECRPP